MTHNQGRARHDSRKTGEVKHDVEATIITHTRRDKKLTEHRRNQTSTRLGRNNQVSPRETPSNHVRNNVSPQARPPHTSTRSRPHKQNNFGFRTLHEVKELHPPVPPRMAPRNGLLTQRWVSTQDTRERKPTKPMELDTARLRPPCRLG
ncbi:hypothetical protein Taro_047105 [Colocasia esculenta]|uniref:Uncharacterized protein n=1 Tax=Colocasia esculenta TaxID=4460 RepID=A0A843X6B7_COLES|nr:hypothetical protein [Colocasia esculenta]